MTVRKVDAVGKLTGEIRFLDDYKPANMLHGCIVFSRFHHGAVQRIEYPSGYNLDDFVVVGAADIPGKNLVPEPECDQPFLEDGEVLHFGQPVLGAAHEDREVLKSFADGIQISFRKLPAIVDPEDALSCRKQRFGKEIAIHFQDRDTSQQTDREAARVAGVYCTSHQEQAYLEPQGMIAHFHAETNQMHVLGTMQCPYYVKDAVESIMGEAITEAVVEVPEGIGGGFGGKEDFPNVVAGIASLLAFKARRPVKIVLDRIDDVLITTKRHPARVEIESYSNRKTGRIEKLSVDYRLDAGAYQTLSPVVLSRGVLHAAGGYDWKDAVITGHLHRSNTPPNGAFRGFGAPQVFFAVESHLDEIAHSLGQDPYELRRRNVLRSGSRFPTTQRVDEDGLFDCMERVVEISDYLRKRKDFTAYNGVHPEKRGIGLSLCFHGAGFTGNGEKGLESEVKIRINRDGGVYIYVSSVDMGQGAYTSLAQIVSDRLNHPLNLTSVRVPNTEFTPDSGPTVASRTIYVVGCILEELCAVILKELKCGNLSEFINRHPGMFPREFLRRYRSPAGEMFDETCCRGPAYRAYSWMATVSEVVYHPDTYTVEPVKIWVVLDAGRLVNRSIAEGQVEGGIVQAVGYALTEFCYKRDYGRISGFTDYALPMSLDIPEIVVEFLNTDSQQAKGLGEIPMNGPAPAIRNALYQATGVFINRIPLTPETIMMHLRGRV